VAPSQTRIPIFAIVCCIGGPDGWPRPLDAVVDQEAGDPAWWLPSPWS
jgi:hypothetical protein